MKALVRKRALITVFLLSMALVILPGSANAKGNAGFESSEIQLLSPAKNNLTFKGTVLLEGTSSLDRVWFCVRGPGGELETWFVDTKEEHFKLDIPMRFGKGTYTVWAGDNATYFDGKIRFEAVNELEKDIRYISNSAYVDSKNPEIAALANSLLKPEMKDMDKLFAIHSWVTSNIAYDYEEFLSGNIGMSTASQTIKEREGTCRDYSFVIAALARAANLEARVVYGETKGESRFGRWHAWNEVRIGDRWVTVDATWDAGYIKDGRFVFSPSTKYLDPDSKVLATTHAPSTYAIH
jgi:hypothetical protein